jgi:hypothetical protein
VPHRALLRARQTVGLYVWTAPHHSHVRRLRELTDGSTVKVGTK